MQKTEHEARLLKTLRRLANFHLLPDGWHFGRGSRISSIAIDFSISLLKGAGHAGLWRSSAFPRVDGGVQLTFLQANWDVELLIEAGGEIDFCIERAGEVTDHEGLSLADALQLLVSTARQICSSEQSILSTTTSMSNASARRLASHPAMEVSLSSSSTVQWVIAVQSMSTCVGTIQEFPLTPQSIGASAPAHSPTFSAGTNRAPATMTLVT